MEPDVRGLTDRYGFCRHHSKKMYDFGNALGNALIMQTYYAGMIEQLEQQVASFRMPDKRPLLGKPKNKEELPLLTWAKEKQSSCYICSRVDYHMGRYFDTFFEMIKDEEFRQKVEASKGCCMHHLVPLLEAAGEHLPNSQREWFYTTLLRLLQENVVRVKGDIDWFCGMFDYRQAGKDWKNSRDAVSRGMQKLRGIYPADPPYKQDT